MLFVCTLLFPVKGWFDLGWNMYFLCEGISNIKLGLDWIVSGNFLFFVIIIVSFKQRQLQV